MEDNQKPAIVMPVAAVREVLHSETFEIVSNPTPADIIQMLARMAQFANLFMAEALRSKVISAANPASAALMNSSATLEQGAIQLQQILNQQRQGAFAGVPGVGPGMGPQGPYRN